MPTTFQFSAENSMKVTFVLMSTGRAAINKESGKINEPKTFDRPRNSALGIGLY
jgi:hypothetical protein